MHMIILESEDCSLLGKIGKDNRECLGVLGVLGATLYRLFRETLSWGRGWAFTLRSD